MPGVRGDRIPAVSSDTAIPRQHEPFRSNEKRRQPNRRVAEFLRASVVRRRRASLVLASLVLPLVLSALCLVYLFGGGDSDQSVMGALARPVPNSSWFPVTSCRTDNAVNWPGRRRGIRSGIVMCCSRSWRCCRSGGVSGVWIPPFGGECHSFARSQVARTVATRRDIGHSSVGGARTDGVAHRRPAVVRGRRAGSRSPVFAVTCEPPPTARRRGY
ncbi:hypothetical protein J2S53_001631 [Actinopolyspora lacussalsi]|nr:hypothetical protein [Actinopolyspora lacussalsi]